MQKKELRLLTNEELINHYENKEFEGWKVRQKINIRKGQKVWTELRLMAKLSLAQEVM